MTPEDVAETVTVEVALADDAPFDGNLLGGGYLLRDLASAHEPDFVKERVAGVAPQNVAGAVAVEIVGIVLDDRGGGLHEHPGRADARAAAEVIIGATQDCGAAVTRQCDRLALEGGSCAEAVQLGALLTPDAAA